MTEPGVTVYEPVEHRVPPLGPYVRTLWARRRFVWHLARATLKAEHYDTTLGRLWMVLNPLLLAGTLFLVRFVIRDPGDDQEALLAHIVWGVFLLQYVRDAMVNGSRSITGAETLVLTAAFPRAILPLAAVAGAALELLPMLGVYAVLHVALGQAIGVELAFLPLVLVLFTVLNVGSALFFGAVNVLFRDTLGFLPYATRLLLYVTPVLYTTAEIPEDVAPFLRLNPLYPFYAATERMLAGQAPAAVHLAAAAAWALAALVVGGTVFLTRERELALRL